MAGRRARAGRGIRRGRSRGRLAAACLALAALSLLLPWALAFDPWAWLVWGREVTRLELDTAGGPSWKPLPVVATTILAPAGDAAPALWLVLARAGGLLAVTGAGGARPLPPPAPSATGWGGGATAPPGASPSPRSSSAPPDRAAPRAPPSR